VIPGLHRGGSEVLARQRCYAMLIGIPTDVSGQPVDSIFKCQAVEENSWTA
jgi:hypothetical protein